MGSELWYLKERRILSEAISRAWCWLTSRACWTCRRRRRTCRWGRRRSFWRFWSPRSGWPEAELSPLSCSWTPIIINCSPSYDIFSPVAHILLSRLIPHDEGESQYKLQSRDDATTTTPFSASLQTGTGGHTGDCRQGSLSKSAKL